MISGLKPYPIMKDSGVPWLGKVPEHWKVLPALAAYRPKLVKNTGMVEKTVLSLSYGRIIVKPPEKLRGLVPESFETYQIVDPGNIIVRTTDLQNDHTSLRMGYSRNRGIITSAYMCLAATSRISEEFGYQFLNAYDLLKIIYGYGSGLRQNLDFSDIKRMPVLAPPPNEQIAIVRLLNYADLLIRRYIRAKQRLIKLLEEQKQAIIHHSVTRGLDPNVRLKPSGVEWLGEVPEYWEVMPLRRVTISRCDGPFGSGLKSAHYTDHGIRVVRLQNIGHAEFKNSDSAFISPMYYVTLGHHTVEPGDVLIAGLGDERHPAGRACVAPAAIMPAMVKADCFRFRLHRQRLEPEFAALHLTATAVDASALLSTGATRQRTNLQSTAARAIVVPPLQEQLEIIQYVADQTSVIRLAIDRAHHEIALLGEYSTRLIADVVTGKLDVRQAAAMLPDESEAPEPLDEVDATSDTGDGMDDDLDEEAVA